MSATKTILKTKPAQIPWLGEIPQKWEVRRLKMLSNIKRGASPRPIDDPKYFDDNGEFAWVRISDVTASDTYLEKTDQQLSELGASLSVKQYPGDLFLSIAGTVGKPIFAKIKCCIHDGFVTFSNLNSAVNRMFLFYILNSGHAYFGLGKEGSQLNLNIDTVGNISIPLPPLHTQTAIVEFLDEKTAKISEFIKNKKELIELLKEQKKSLIYEAVTGKINNNEQITNNNQKNSPREGWQAKPDGVFSNSERNKNPSPAKAGTPQGENFKPSGIPWLGEIPDGWEVVKLKKICKFEYGESLSSDNRSEEGQIPVYGSNGVVGMHDLAITKAPTIIIGRKGSFGKVNISLVPCFPIDTTFYIDSTKTNQNIYWLHYLLPNLRLDEVSDDSAVPGLSREKAYDNFIPLPPLHTQTAIVEFLDEKTAKIDETITTISQEIELVEEYKKSLIYQVVTGKIEINNNE